MKLELYGLTNKIKETIQNENKESFDIGRIISQHKERYIVATEDGIKNGEITGNLRYSASSPECYPSVGDWVALQSYDSKFVVIHKVFTRYSKLVRQKIGKDSNVQLIAANVDYAFLVQAVNRDFNINRLERYLSLCYSDNINPIIILTKIDLISASELRDLTSRISQRINTVPIVAISNNNEDTYINLFKHLYNGKTYSLLGSSGVGKSTLVNNLLNNAKMKTKSISQANNKGKHTTTHRELFVLENGAIIIDNPGMREVGITDISNGIDSAFDLIVQLSEKCKFSNCSHTSETGCAVLNSIELGELSEESYKNYLKLEKEREHFESSLYEKRKKDKAFGKMIKQHLHSKKRKKLY